ncbi:MAG: EamA family transporter, partial [Gemmiger sp.]
LAFTSFMQGVKLIGPEKGILYSFSEPVTAAVLATVLLGSPFSVWDAVGFAAVFAMMILLSVGPRLQERQQPAVQNRNN